MGPTVVMLYPGHSAEDEYDALARRVGVRLPVLHTWEGPTHHDVAALRALGSREQLAPSAAAARDLSPDAVMWACTSGSFVYGATGVHEQAGWVADAAGVPASSTSIAFLAAVEELGLGRVGVAATYPEPVTRHFLDLLGSAGTTVVSARHHDVPSGEDAGRLAAAAVRDLVRSGHRPGVDAVLVPDTALHTLAVIDELEAELGCMVLTANQVTAWHGLRLAGWSGTADGVGRLFGARRR